MLGNPMKYCSQPTQENEEIIHSHLRNKSVFHPNINDNKHVEVFKKLVIQDVRNLKIKKREEPRYIKTAN